MNGEELLRSADSPPARAAAQDPDRRRLVLLPPASQSLASPLVLVQVSIGRLVDGLPILARGPRGDPDADLDVLRRAHPQSGVVDRAAEAGRHVAGAIDVRLRHGDRKLIAAYPRAQVGCTDHAQELLSHEPQRAVTALCPSRSLIRFRLSRSIIIRDSRRLCRSASATSRSITLSNS